MSNASAYHLVVQTGTLVKLPALFYSGRGRALSFVLALLFATVSVRAQTKIRSLTNVIEGHAVGGVTVDLVGNMYVADFGEYVWKITPEGKRDVFASGLMARLATQSTMKATSCKRISTPIQSRKLIEKVKCRRLSPAA
jgi:hypothetical protein